MRRFLSCGLSHGTRFGVFFFVGGVFVVGGTITGGLDGGVFVVGGTITGGFDGTDGGDFVGGLDGTDGTDGVDGTGGFDGTDGGDFFVGGVDVRDVIIDGTDGTDGVDGIEGLDGTDGGDFFVVVLNDVVVDFLEFFTELGLFGEKKSGIL